MGLVKKKSTTVASKKAENGTNAAISRLKSAKPAGNGAKAKPKFKLRDADKVALGKTRCVQFQSALESPAIAGMQFTTMDEYIALVTQAADAGVAYSFQE